MHHRMIAELIIHSRCNVPIPSNYRAGNRARDPLMNPHSLVNICTSTGLMSFGESVRSTAPATEEMKLPRGLRSIVHWHYPRVLIGPILGCCNRNV